MSEQPKLPPGWEDVDIEPATEPTESGDPGPHHAVGWSAAYKPDAEPEPPVEDDDQGAEPDETLYRRQGVVEAGASAVEALAEYVATNPRITSELTTKRYDTAIGSLTRYLRRPAMLADFTGPTFAAWIKWRRDHTTAAAGTIRGDAEKVLVIWRWAARHGAAEMPNVALPAKAELNPVAWTPEEMAKLEEAARNSERYIGRERLPCYLFWPALIGVGFETGERVQAIHSLEASDIHLDRRIIVFRAATRKGKRKDNVRQITAETAEAIRKLLAVRPQRPFAPVQYQSLYTPLRWLLVDAGLPRDRRRMMHCLRKTHATHVHVQGGNASDSLGHSDPRTTESYIDRSQVPLMIPERASNAPPSRMAKPTGLMSKLFGRGNE